MKTPTNRANAHVSRAGLAAQAIIEAVLGLVTRRSPPVLIALDGPSGSGKSTVASLVASGVRSTIVPADDFYAAEITEAEWAERGVAERVAAAIDWRRLRRQALEPLLSGNSAQWHTFDFAAGPRADGSYPMQSAARRRDPADVVIVEGAYSARPELGDLLDLTVLVDAPAAVRQRRLSEREDPAFLRSWHELWDAAEAYYFARVRPPSAFDLVVSTDDSSDE